MSIEREDDIFTVFCDTEDCLNSSDFEVDGDFDLLIDEMKQEGWRSSKQSGEWINTCPDCVKKEQEALNQILGDMPTGGEFFGRSKTAVKRSIK